MKLFVTPGSIHQVCIKSACLARNSRAFREKGFKHDTEKLLLESFIFFYIYI